MVRAFDGSDFVGIGGPSEGAWECWLCSARKRLMGRGGQGASENAAPEATLRRFREEARDGVEPRTRGRRELKGEALMAVEPGAHVEMLVGGIVVEDDVDCLVGRQLDVDGIEKTDELLMPVTLHVPPDDGAVDDVEGGKKCRRAVPHVVVGRGVGPPFLQGQTGLGAVRRLDVALLIDRQHGGTSAVRRIWNLQSLQPHRWRIVALQRPAVRPMAYARCGRQSSASSRPAVQ